MRNGCLLQYFLNKEDYDMLEEIDLQPTEEARNKDRWS